MKLLIPSKEWKKMTKHREVPHGLMQDESGQDLIEYALIASLIGLAAIASMKNAGTMIMAAFNSIGATVNTVASGH